MDPIVARLLVVLGIVVGVTLLGRLARARDGRMVVTPEDAPRDVVAAETRTGLGLADGRSAVLFGSPTCAPCDTVKGLLRELEDDDPSFSWTYVDAAEHLDLADEHRVRRVPTLLVMDADGAVTARTSGVPARDELRRAVGVPAAA